jgi:hypothetical protein
MFLVYFLFFVYFGLRKPRDVPEVVSRVILGVPEEYIAVIIFLISFSFCR